MIRITIFSVVILFLGLTNNAQVIDNIDDALAAKDTVTRLNLSSRNLTELPGEITALKQLKYLNLNSNHFLSFPEEIFALENLEELHIQGGDNYIEKYENENLLHTVPPEIKKLKKLKVLNLSYNQIEGLPAEISELPNLQKLDLYHNALSVENNLERIFQIKNLEFLSIGGNDITELPESVKNLQKLKILDLSNSYSEGVPSGEAFGSFPDAVLELSDLEVLGLSGHSFVSLPDDIARLKHLKELYLEDTGIRSVPKILSKLKNLEKLSIGHYCCDENMPECNDLFPIPESLCRLKHLKEISAYGRNIEQSDIERIEKCLGIKVLR